MSDLITLRNSQGRYLASRETRVPDDGDDDGIGEGTNADGGEGGGDIVAEGIDTENPKGDSSRGLSAARLRAYSACLAYFLANKQLTLANNLYDGLKRLKKEDTNHFTAVKNGENQHYEAQHLCAMSIAKTSMARTIGRKMYDTLNGTDMYSAGLKRSIIEDSFAALVEEAAPLQAMSYRDEFNLDDKSYLDNRGNLIGAIDKSSMYVATAAMQNVANTQVDLGLYAADARNESTLDKIDNVAKLVTGLETIFTSDAVKGLFKAKPESGFGGSDKPSQQFGTQAPVRPDNPSGFVPGAGLTGSNVNVGGGNASIPASAPRFTTGK